MPTPLEKLLSDLDQFIDGIFHQEVTFLLRLGGNKRFDEKSYGNGIDHLKLYLKTVNSDNPKYSRILVALAIFHLLSPTSTENASALQYLEEAIRYQNLTAMCVLGYCYENGIGVPRDPAKAVELYQKATDGENAIAAFNLGCSYLQGIGVPKNPAKAAEYFEKAWDGRLINAASLLGTCYQDGVGVVKNLAKAVELYQKAVDGGNAAATNNLGYCYQHGIGVVKDRAKAVELYQKAVDSGSASAAKNLGYCYRYGSGVVKNHAKAVELYQKAVDGGDVEAANSLGYCYGHGIGVAQDHVKAANFYLQAVAGGNVEAVITLGLCYQQGAGVSQDELKAISLFISAINAAKTSQVSDKALKWLQFCLNQTSALAPVDFAAVAKCCARACKQFPQSEGCKTAKEILSSLAGKTNNSEVHYWATLIPTWGETFCNLSKLQDPIVGLIQKDPNAFMDCLLKDDVHTLEEKQANFNLALANCKEEISGRKVLLFLHQRGELDNLRTLKPLTFFSLLPKELLPLFANGKDIATNPPIEATKYNQEPSALSPKPGG